MRSLTDKEIVATTFRYIPGEKTWSSYGYTYPKRDKNEMCPYCKNEDTDVVTDQAFLNGYKRLFKGRDFKVMECPTCTAIFAWVK